LDGFGQKWNIAHERVFKWLRGVLRNVGYDALTIFDLSDIDYGRVDGDALPSCFQERMRDVATFNDYVKVRMPEAIIFVPFDFEERYTAARAHVPEA